MDLQSIKSRLSKINWVYVGGIILLLVAVYSAWYNWQKPAQIINRTQYQPVAVEKRVETIKRVTVPGPEKIVTIEKQVIVEKLGLPPEIKTDPAKQITANADIPPSKGGTSTVAVLDTTTGETTIIAKEKPLSFFGLPSEFELGVRYGASTEGGQLGAGYGRWTFARFGKIYLGGYTEITTKPDAKAMVDVSYRF